MGVDALATRLGIIKAEARSLLERHRETYRTFWRWSDRIVEHASITGSLQTVFGWPLKIGGEANPRSLRNFPMQANGAEMMRIAAIAATEAGIEVCAPVHDAFLIMAPLERLEDDVAAMRCHMGDASKAVLDGFEVRTDAQLFCHPDRYIDEGGSEMWETVARILADLNGNTD